MPLGRAIGILAVLAYGPIIPVAILLPETKVRPRGARPRPINAWTAMVTVCRLYRKKRDL